MGLAAYTDKVHNLKIDNHFKHENMITCFD